MLALPGRRIKGILCFLRDLHIQFDENGTLKLSKLNALDLLELEASMEATNLRWHGGEGVKQLAQKLQSFNGIQAVEPPSSLRADLRNYQKTGLNWLQFLREYQLGGILADDMGLGKTVQTLAHILYEKEQGRLTKPFLVIAPTSLMVNWDMESKRFATELKTLVLHGPERRKHFNSLKNYELILTTYPCLFAIKKSYLNRNFIQ